MITCSTPRLLALVLIPLVLSACASQTPNTPAEVEIPAHADFLFDAAPIPLAVTQALVLEDRLTDGTSLSTLAVTDTFTFTTVDFYGAPFTHVSITAPEPIADLWGYAATLTEADWAGATNASPWRVTVTGATTARSVMFQQEIGLDTLLKLYETVKAVGGPDNFKEIVSALPGVEYVRAKDGTIWDPETLKPIDPDLLTFAREQYAEVVEANASNAGQADALAPVGMVNSASVAPESRLTDLQAWTQILSSPVATMALGAMSATGDLDARVFTRNLELSPLWRPPDDKGALRGAMPKTPYSNSFWTRVTGYSQRTQDWGRGKDQNWQYFDCTVGSTVFTKSIGCGPSAFAGLLVFHFEYRNRQILNRSYQANNNADSIRGLLWGLTEPRAGRPLVSWFLGTCYFNGGGATAANAFAGGISRFVRDYAPGMRATYSWSRFAGNKGNSGSKLKILKWAMWRNSAGWPMSRSSEVPVIAEYFPSASGHYAAVQQWRASSGPGWNLLVQTENHPNVWSSISSNWTPETGVYAIY